MKIHLTSDGFELTSELEKYAISKMTQVAKRMPHKLRADVTIEVHFARGRQKTGGYSTCRVTFTSGGEVFIAEETTQHMYAALDIAAVHIEHQVADYMVRHHLVRSEWNIP